MMLPVPHGQIPRDLAAPPGTWIHPIFVRVGPILTWSSPGLAPAIPRAWAHAPVPTDPYQHVGASVTCLA